MKVLALRLVEIDGPCPWCGGLENHTNRCAFYGQPGAVPPKADNATPPYTHFEKTSLEMFRDHQRKHPNGV